MIISMLTMLVSCSSSDGSGSTSSQMGRECFACGRRATKRWRDGRWYCNSCYAYCETIWQNS
ncbi:MAG: hypothetical protein PUG65_03040, partial [Firmicutes bacterium]|nr:hypothetical protein [Bacillota bacterium]